MEVIKTDLTKETVVFKSRPEYFEKEQNGNKPNTVRDIDLTEEKFRILVMMMQTRKYGYIKITDTNPLRRIERSFVRRIQDITLWKNIMIISWKYER